MNITKDSFFEKIKQEFAAELIKLSKGLISQEDAIKIANIHLRPTDFSDESPLQHKSIKWLAMNYLDLI